MFFHEHSHSSTNQQLLFVAEEYCVDIPQFVYPLTCWQMSSLFPVLAIVNKVAINIYAYIFCEHKFSIHMDKNLGLGHPLDILILYLIFWEC